MTENAASGKGTDFRGKEKIPIKQRLHALQQITLPNWSVPLALLVLCILSYLLLIRYLGFYWDDWPFIWISQKLGSDGLIRYFHTNRPIWGWLFQFTTPMLGHEPWRWHLFALFWRWAASVLLWLLLRLVWPRHPQPALWTSMLFAVYPGSQEQFIALVFSHFFIILSAFFGSLACSVLALRRPRLYMPLTIAGLLFSMVNLLSMEYFFLLELLRPALLWIAVTGSSSNRKQRMIITIRHSLPYLLLFAGIAVWRAFFFTSQTANYTFDLLNDLKTSPLSALLSLLWTVLHDLFLTTFGAWGQIFITPDPASLGLLTTITYVPLVLGVLAGLLGYLFLSQVTLPDRTGSSPDQRVNWALQALLLGILCLLLAGPPYWLTGLNVNLNFPFSRTTLSFMLGSSLMLAGLLGLLPLPYRARLAVLAMIVSWGVGMQFLNANDFRRDNSMQQALFWQTVWRMPDIKPGTALLMNELPLKFSTDNSLTAVINWIYSPDNSSAVMDYYLFYPDMRLGTSLPELVISQSIAQNYLAATFYGSTEQVIALNFEPSACLRVLDPEIDPVNPLLPDIMRYAAEHSSAAHILSMQSGDRAMDPELFGPEPEHSWCYFFEKADLARQTGDWQKVAALGDTAFALDDPPNDPAEHMPFIEGYAHVGEWERAVTLTEESYQFTDLIRLPLCRLWRRIAVEAPESVQKTAALEAIQEMLECPDE